MRKKTGPKRRNTLTIDDDNAVRLERLRKERDLSFKQIVNDVLRRGLNEAEKPFRPKERFETQVFRNTQPAFKTEAEFKELVDQLDVEDALRKLGRL
ncbi:MAG: hypothetical protein WDM86_15905 [Rhizomicrobium sp.]